MIKNDGGFAFPRSATSKGHCFDGNTANEGMTLRDYFASAVLIGTLSNVSLSLCSNEELAEQCYAMADAMLKVKEK
jgi:hypothetical protein